MTDRCTFSDLPVTQCGHCLGVGPALGKIGPLPKPQPVRPAGYVPAWSPADDKRPTPRDWTDGDRAPSSSTRCHRTSDGRYLLAEHVDECRDRTCNGCRPCTHDEHGNPVTHCEARPACTEHLDAAHPRTCPRCIARVRANLAQIERLTGLMLDEAVVAGVDSEAAMIAGPAADPADLTALREWLTWHGITDLPEHDDRHPYTLLARLEQELAEHYGHERHGEITLASAISYLSWLLTDIAQDPTQNFAKIAGAIARSRSHLESVLGASRAPERGAPCWECPSTEEKPAPRLVRRRAHWCEREECTREHDATGARDTWQCPANRDHWWTEAEYRKATIDIAFAQGFQPPRRGRAS